MENRGLDMPYNHRTNNEQRKYAGYEYDVSTALNYLNSRYYDGKVARFLSQDPAFLLIGDKEFEERYSKPLEEFLADPQLLNSYSYARGNPIEYVDENGELGVSNLKTVGAILWGTLNPVQFAGVILQLLTQPNFAQGGPTLTPSQQTFVNTVNTAGFLPIGGSLKNVAQEGAEDVAKAADKAIDVVKKGTKLLKPVGSGSTGRTVAKNLNEQLAMEEIMSNPQGLGREIIPKISDPRWADWSKFQYSKKLGDGTKITIHFNAFLNKAGKIIKIDDFKFINP